MHPSVYCSAVYNSQDTEATQMSTDRGMDKDIVHMYNAILLSHKKNKIMLLAATWTDLEIIILTEVSQTEERQVSYDIAYMCNLKKKKKKTQMNLFTKQKQTHRLRETNYGYQRGKGGREGYTGGLGLTCTHCCILNRYPTSTSVGQRTLLNTL